MKNEFSSLKLMNQSTDWLIVIPSVKLLKQKVQWAFEFIK